ncbi:hypothetical protein MQE36_04560 [Zhouia spongiae]|uniref:Transporter n=1 Tax=Zhouia spongiae TaxID=2202721 RepID=A0ABY3YP69_9FLAO|nr:hypothetical protein [Zhouia spongiae]UNY99620.1 hypothetical protein MQE36_04560 [Zhouia spongiae]
MTNELKKLLSIFFFLSGVSYTYAQDRNASSADELAKKLQNPVASLISVPFQGNMDFGVGPEDGTRFTLNIQPVIPISISEKWNLIGRAIVPFISQSDVFGNSGNQTGLSDAVISSFFSPKEATKGGIIWGAGPVLLAPTATDDLLGTKKFGVGPTGVILKQVGGYTVGALVNHIWSVAGNEDRPDVNATFLQPFIAHNFSGGYALALNTEFTQNWEADSSSGTVHLVGSKVISLGSQLAQVLLGPRVHYGNGNSAGWGIRGGIVLLFPK